MQSAEGALAFCLSACLLVCLSILSVCRFDKRTIRQLRRIRQAKLVRLIGTLSVVERCD